MVRVLFLHPDLGIGGAERLIVDAALALKKKGHSIAFLTNHHDPSHCFEETINGTFEPVHVVGDWMPRSIFGRFYAFCAYFRMLYAAFYASFCLTRKEHFDVIICDQISIGIPVLRLAQSKPKIIFYCHFPDQLLSKREGVLKKFYRAPINFLEEITIGMADVKLVNSKFTLKVFRETFKRLDAVIPEVLYPSLNTDYFDKMEAKNAVEPVALPLTLPLNTFVFLDINRYERKKNHALAIKAFRLLLDEINNKAEANRCLLIIAGGYDHRVVENVEHFQELMQLVHELNLIEQVVLLQSPSDAEKFALLRAAHCLIYTPANEHFGIVPLESMYMSKPVVAVKSGGPTETIVHNSTGMLMDDTPKEFAMSMLQLFKNDALRQRMGEMGHKRVEQKFSFEAFANKLDHIVQEVLQSTSQAAMKKKN